MKVYGAVLAGGRSSRMGQPKADLLLRGVCLLQRAIDLLRNTLGLESVVWLSLRADGEEPSELSGHCQVVRDLHGEVGPLSGIASVLQAEAAWPGESWILFIPVDMPGLGAETLQLAVRECFREGASVECISFAGYELPLVLKNTATVNQILNSLLSLEAPTPREQRSLRHLKSLLMSQTIALPPAQDEEFQNLNTPLDWKRFLAGYS